MNTIINRWHAWAADSATRRQRMSELADADFDAPRPRMTRVDVVMLTAILSGSSAMTVWAVTLLLRAL